MTTEVMLFCSLKHDIYQTMSYGQKPSLLCGSCNTPAGCSAVAKSVFKGLNDESFKSMNDEKHSRQYKKGQTIFIEGHPHHGLFCINSGKVKLIKGTVDGRETIMRIAKPGDVIGGVGFLNKTGYATTAVVIEDAVICLISDDLFQDLLLKDRVLALNMVRRWDEEMKEAQEVAHALAHKNSKGRLAFILLNLYQDFHGADEIGSFLDVQLTREEYASLVGVAVENVIRCFAELKRDVILSENKKRIYIQDLSRLQEAAQR
ncbi:MAG: Crp/Fnr family transcriptional regulator [Bdellovibrionaceae bacterium]|nr:Crp/Fnr family transcriptional regulator [Pseudobdellovibrionaceae bacterium]